MGLVRINRIIAEIIALTLLCLAVVGSLPGRAVAGGFFLYEVGTPDVGLASAGYASRAQDASTVFTNPAGMTRLDHSELMVGVQPYYGYQVFSTNHNTNRTGSDGGNALVPLPLAPGRSRWTATITSGSPISSARRPGIAIDPAGNVWVSNNWQDYKSALGQVAEPLSTLGAGQGLVVFYGMAKPVRTPQIGPARPY